MRKIYLALLLLTIFSSGFSQSTDPARDEQNLIFQYIDKTQIPSGYLDEYGPQVVDKNGLNGVLVRRTQFISNRIKIYFLLK